MDITIIIPYLAKNETLHFAEKLLNYYLSTLKDVDFIWALSGDEMPREKVRHLIEKNPKHTIIENNETDIGSGHAFFDKVIQSVSYAKTSYVLLCAVDDFMLAKAIEKAVHILDTSPDVAAIYGKCLIYGFDKEFVSQTYPSRIETSPVERMKNTLNIYGPTFYSIQRRKPLKARLEKAKNYSQDDIFNKTLNNQELALALDLALEGKIVSLDELFTVRQCHNDNAGSSVEPFDISVATGSFNQFIGAYYEYFRKDFPDVSYRKYKSWFRVYTLRYLLISFKPLVYGLIKGRYRLFGFVKLIYFLFLKNFFNLHRPSGQLNESDLKIMQSEDFRVLKNYLS